MQRSRKSKIVQSFWPTVQVYKVFVFSYCNEFKLNILLLYINYPDFVGDILRKSTKPSGTNWLVVVWKVRLKCTKPHVCICYSLDINSMKPLPADIRRFVLIRCLNGDKNTINTTDNVGKLRYAVKLDLHLAY